MVIKIYIQSNAIIYNEIVFFLNKEKEHLIHSKIYYKAMQICTQLFQEITKIYYNIKSIQIIMLTEDRRKYNINTIPFYVFN